MPKLVKLHPFLLIFSDMIFSDMIFSDIIFSDINFLI